MVVGTPLTAVEYVNDNIGSVLVSMEELELELELEEEELLELDEGGWSTGSKA